MLFTCIPWSSSELLALAMSRHYFTDLSHLQTTGYLCSDDVEGKKISLQSLPWLVWQAMFLWLCGQPHGMPWALPTLPVPVITNQRAQ